MIILFGYIMPFKPELKICEWGEYRAYYCGLCKELKREYGFLPRFFLNYDFVLPAIISDSLRNEAPHKSNERCMANPFSKQCVCTSSYGLRFAADSLILTMYYKCTDDVNDERGLKRVIAKLLRFSLRNKHRKAALRLPQLDSVLMKETELGHNIELSGCKSPDEAADATAKMTSAMFSFITENPAYSKAVTRMGLCVGKLIYYLDAAEDYNDDKKHGAFNLFINMGLNADEAIIEAKRICNMCAGELALCYNLLDLQVDKPLLDNIVFLGIQDSIRNTGIKRKKGKDRD
ncbi:MAG: DUF5685 family protein [Oscillospiraceae bacterium]